MDDLLSLYVGQRSDATAARRLLYLNEAQKAIALSFFFDELETLNSTIATVDGTASYNFPTNDYHVELIRIVDTSPDVDEPLTQKDWDWYDKNHGNRSTETGIPEFWAVHQGKIYLDPTPDDAYTLRTSGRRLPADIATSPSTSCVLPVDWHIIVILGAAYRMMFMFGNDTRGMTLKNEYLGEISARQEKRTLRRVRGRAQINPGVIKFRG